MYWCKKVERAILTIVLIVALVGVVGLFASYDFTTGEDALTNGVTGNVIVTQQSCNSCSGTPVCAKMNNRYVTFDNSCKAECAGATVVMDGSCNQLARK